MKKILAIALALCMIFALCAVASADEPIVLRVMSGMMAEKVEGGIEQEIADDFMKAYPNITIEFIPMPTNDTQKTIVTLATSGELPDIVGVQPTWLAQFDEMGIFEDLRPLMGEDYVNTFFEGALYEASVGDKILMCPWLCTPAALLYRADWFEEAGIQAPTTWDEFLEAAKAMTQDTDGDGVIDRWGFSMVGTRNNSGESRFVAMSRTWGVDEVRQNADGVWESGLLDPEFKDFLTFFTNLNNEYKVVPTGAVETGYSEAANYFATGKTAMMVTGSNAIGLIKSQSPEVAEKMASCMLPTGVTTCAATGIGGYCISADSEYKEAAMEYLKFTLLPENILKFAAGTGRMPTQKDVFNDELFTQEIFNGYVAMLDHPYKQPVYAGYAELLDVIGEAYTNIMSGSQSVDEAMKVVETRTNEVLAKNQ